MLYLGIMNFIVSSYWDFSNCPLNVKTWELQCFSILKKLLCNKVSIRTVLKLILSKIKDISSYIFLFPGKQFDYIEIYSVISSILRVVFQS